MSQALIVSIIVIYFLVLVAISLFTSRKASNDTFFLGEKKSPWYVVSFGMIGASLSGVTFISIPGWVGNDANQFSYMQMVFGYLIGYLVVAFVLIPLYYRMNLVSIYEYLKDRFGFWSYKTGAFFFLGSRIIGASVRLLLVANVLQSILFDAWGIPFEVTVVISILLIWVYTNRGGIKTIVWTDTLQTAFMLASVILTVWFISDSLDLSDKGGAISAIADSGYSKIFYFEDFMGKNHFLKHFFGGMFITIGMTGLDQDMMQKNLSCKSTKDAQKNVLSMAVILVFVNLIFLSLGALLYMFVDANPEITYAKPDLLFSSVALSDGVGATIGVLFLLGLIAAAYSSADSALTSLTTSFSVDFLGVGNNKKAIEEKPKSQDLVDDVFENKNEQASINVSKKDQRTRKIVHVSMSVLLILVVIILKYATDESAIGLLMKFAGFTYGPLIGMFFFGIITKRRVADIGVPIVSIVSIALTYFIWYFSFGAPGVPENEPGILGSYQFGFELIILNALLTFGMLAIISKSAKKA